MTTIFKIFSVSLVFLFEYLKYKTAGQSYLLFGFLTYIGFGALHIFMFNKYLNAQTINKKIIIFLFIFDFMFALAMLLQIDGGSGFVWTNIISLLHSGTSLHNISDGPMWMMITALLHGGVLGESIPTGWPRDVSFFGAGSGNIAALVPWVVMFVIANKRVNNLH